MPNSSTKIKIPQNTFLQKLLGRNYKWWFLLRFSFKSGTTYRYSNLFWLFGSLVNIVAILVVWYANSLNGSTLYSFPTIFTYFVVSGIANELFEINFYGNLANEIYSGKINNKLLWTTNLFGFYFVRHFGKTLLFRIYEIILLILVLIFGFQFLILSSFWNFIFFILLQFLGMITSVILSFIIGFAAFFMTECEGLINFVVNIKNVSAGKLFPLTILPITQFLIYSPFALFYYHPMQIYLGKYDTFQTVLVFGGGIFWCVLLYFLAKFVFKMGLKKNESVGF